MFLDLNPDRPWDDQIPCKSCKRPILADHATEQLQLPFDSDHKLHELNGLYHSHCAQPYLGIVRALEAMNRLRLYF